MLDNTLNSNSEGVVQPQNELAPDDIKNMSVEDFSSYLTNPEPQADVPTDEESNVSEPADGSEVDTVPTADTDGAAEAGSNPANPADPFRVFNTEEEYTQAVNELVNSKIRKRLSKHKEQAKKYEMLETMAAEYYPDAQNPIERLSQDLQTQAAEDAGVDVEEYKRRIQMRRDADSYKKLQSDQEKRDEIINGWRRDAEEIKYINPEFDLGTAMRDSTFSNVLRSGGSVLAAYSAMRKAAEQGGNTMLNNATSNAGAANTTVQPAGTGGGQPNTSTRAAAVGREPLQENGAAVSASGSRATVNPATMSRDEFKRYIEKCRDII